MAFVALDDLGLTLEIAWVDPAPQNIGTDTGRERVGRRMPQKTAALQAAADIASDDPVMIFLHEGLGSVALWKDFPERICAATGLRGLLYSRPGYGRSTPRRSDEHWGPDFMHRQALEVLPALRAQLGLAQRPVWLFGHSDGATIALLHAALQTQPVQGMVVMAPHVFVEPISIASIQAALAAYPTSLRERLARFHDDVDSAFHGWAGAWLSPEFKAWTITHELGGISCPTLLIQGDEDEYGTLAQLDAIGAQLPQALRLTLPQCGHSPHRDQPDAVISATCRIVAAALHSNGDLS